MRILNSEIFDVWNSMRPMGYIETGPQKTTPQHGAGARMQAGPLGRYAHKFSFPQTSKDDIKAKKSNSVSMAFHRFLR